MNENKINLEIKISNPCQIVDLPEENRFGVLEVKNTTSWYVVQCDLSAYAQQYVTIKYSVEIKRVGASGNLQWQINDKGYPRVGNSIKKATTDTWHKMWGERTIKLTDSASALYLNTWKNNSERTTYYIDNFTAEIIVNPKKERVEVSHKPLSETAEYLKGLLPANIPANYSIKPMFKNISNEENIRNGILRFKDFLEQLYDRLIVDANQYDKPKTGKLDKHPSMTEGYPFLFNVISVLINIGEHGELTENGDSMLLRNRKALTTLIISQGGLRTAKISAPKLTECLNFLTSCGIYFDDVDIEKPDLSSAEPITISYPDNPIMLTGLRVMAVAQRELCLGNRENQDVLLRCDYRVLINEDSDITDVLRDFISPLPAKTQEFALELHKRYIEAGLVCTAKISASMLMITYSYKRNVIWEFATSFRSGYRIFIKAVRIHKYPDVISQFPSLLQEKISEGFGCQKSLGKPCEKGCHGYSFPLDDSILDVSKDIKLWIDAELSCLR